MGLFSRKKIEERADPVAPPVTPPVDSVLLESLLGRATLTKEQALNIPSVAGCIKYAADTISMLPVKLYKEENGKVVEIKNDHRLKLLNDDTGDTLDAVQFWRAMVTDYYLGKGGYGYIKRNGNEFASIHYVDEKDVSINTTTDPIFKDYGILVNASIYKPFDFIKILRNTKDGAKGKSIIEESPIVLSVAYNSLVYEETLVKKGGNKKGFLKSSKKLSQEVIDGLKDGFKKLYSNNSDNIVVLNEGIDFAESSNTSVEMQLNENKKTNSEEVCKLFLFPTSVINGTASEKEYSNAFKMGVLPLLRAITSALNRDMLLEREKQSFYFAFDTKEMLKGSIKERFEAYGVAIEKGFMKIDEARYMEDWEAFDIDWINLGLNSVLYDTKTKSIYTPNTNQQQNMADIKKPEESLKPEEVKEDDSSD